MADVEVYAIGSPVMLASEIPAFITSINLRGSEYRVLYECTWWDGRTRKAEWFDPLEITMKEPRCRRLKFIFSQTSDDPNPVWERLGSR